MLQKKWNVMLVCASTVLLASCQTPSDNSCNVFGPIFAQSTDTRSTQNQVAVHNQKGIRVCGWKPKGGGSGDHR